MRHKVHDGLMTIATTLASSRKEEKGRFTKMTFVRLDRTPPLAKFAPPLASCGGVLAPLAEENTLRRQEHLALILFMVYVPWGRVIVGLNNNLFKTK